MKNLELALLFEHMGDALEFKGGNRFKIAAYRKAALALRDLVEDIERLFHEGRLREVPGVGEGIAQKIEEFLKTGRMRKYFEVTEGVPEEFFTLLGIQGLGPKTLMLARDRLGVKTLIDLKKVIDEGSLAGLPGMGERKLENIRKGVALFEKARGRMPLGLALPLVEKIVAGMKTVELTGILPAGSLRRMKETIGDIDILATGSDHGKIIGGFIALPMNSRVLAQGETKASVIATVGPARSVQVDVRVVDEPSFGAAAQYFTGSRAHNIHLRTLAKKKGLKINEYGVFKGERRIAGTTEEEVYGAMGLPWIAPELREDAGEIERAMTGSLPELVELKDIKADLHIHSTFSDGQYSLPDMARAARARGYSYIAMTDHSQGARYAHGMSIERAWAQIEEIEELNKTFDGFTILKGVEADILADGSIDCPESLLGAYDLVIASIHSGFTKNCTERLLTAMEHPRVNIIGHPTGRLLSGREGYALDMARVLQKAARTNTTLEINAYYDRLDLCDVNCRRAKEAGVKCVINTDAHSPEMLRSMPLGVATARRGWLEKKDVLNTYPLSRFCSLILKK